MKFDPSCNFAGVGRIQRGAGTFNQDFVGIIGEFGDGGSQVVVKSAFGIIAVNADFQAAYIFQFPAAMRTRLFFDVHDSVSEHTYRRFLNRGRRSLYRRTPGSGDR